MSGSAHVSWSACPGGFARMSSMAELAGALASPLRRIAHATALWRHRSQERAALSRMSEVQLRDIGVSRVEAWAESNKPFWRP